MLMRLPCLARTTVLILRQARLSHMCGNLHAKYRSGLGTCLATDDCCTYGSSSMTSSLVATDDGTTTRPRNLPSTCVGWMSGLMEVNTKHTNLNGNLDGGDTTSHTGVVHGPLLRQHRCSGIEGGRGGGGQRRACQDIPQLTGNVRCHGRHEHEKGLDGLCGGWMDGWMGN